MSRGVGRCAPLVEQAEPGGPVAARGRRQRAVRHATGLGHTEIARRLVDDHGVGGWYAQSITVGYEQERGLRTVGQSSGGGWQAGGDRTVDAPVASLDAAFTDEAVRRRWLPVGEFSVRSHRAGKTLTADFSGAPGGPPGRISVRFTATGEAKTRVSLAHTKLADGDAVAAAKAFWRERLGTLKVLLES
ncbi:hypothetical protein [Streptomyces sp. H27-C3]|uniref:hypothetical protein n=1 Tax=Streptomyces sp. H27-C3 TaxID=3046305 RepID=UPI0024BAF5F2|nr:hypothetical protein [Streptomyces sp. H27-C3]MDJ0464477.1 hypothetical protein [Streptomyces sp. H27-C3]